MRSHLFGAGTQIFLLGLPGGSRRLTSGGDFAGQQCNGHCVRKLCSPWALRTFVVALLTVSALLPATAQVKPVRRVLVFNDFGSVSSPGIAEMDREIFDGLQNSSYMVEFYNENLEVTLFPEDASQRQVREWYVRKYSDRRPDVIITVGPASLRFMQEMNEGPFKDTPVVFCGIMEIPAELKANFRFTGAWSGVQTEKTMESALRLQPGTRHVVVVGGIGSLDRQEEAIVRENLRGYESKFDFTYLTDLSMPNLLEQLKLLPSNTIVLHTAITQDAAGNRFIDATQAVPMVAGAARAPVFVVDDVDLRNGAVGGDVLSWTATARDAAKSALRILNGEKPQDIPIIRSDNVYMFDWRALRRWGLKETNLPPGSIVLNRQPTLWESFRWYVIGGMTLILAEALLISGLLWQRTRRKAAESKLTIANKQLEADIADRKRAEATLRESEERFRLVANTAPVMIWMSGPDKLCTYLNHGWLEYTGQSLSEEMGNGWGVGLHPEDLAPCLGTYEQAFDRREPFQMQYRLRRHDGEYRWVIDHGVPRFNADGSFAGYIGSCIDVTERKLAEENTERFLSVFDYSAVGMALVGYDGRWLRVNRALCEILGYSEQELLATSFQSLTHPDDLGADLSYAQKVFTGQLRFYHLEKRYIHKQGHAVWVTLTASAVPDASGKASYGVAQVQDITARKNAEAALRRSQEELQSLAGRLITVQEEERKRIARDLHDDLSQRLALLCVDLDMLRQSLPGGAQAARELERMRHEVDELVVDMRRLSHNEHHPQLALGLQHGVTSFCHDFSRQHGIAAKVVHEGDLKRIPEIVCFTLFRVLQEAMSNVAKHSGADRVTITLRVYGDQAVLHVTDEGRGFEIGSGRGLGLISMRERLRLVGGTMRVNSSPLQGTDVEAVVPVPTAGEALSASACI